MQHRLMFKNWGYWFLFFLPVQSMNEFIHLFNVSEGQQKIYFMKRNVYFIKGWSVTPGQPLPTVVKGKSTSIWSVSVNHGLVCFLNTKIVFLSCFPELTKWWLPKYNKEVFSVFSNKEIFLIPKCQTFLTLNMLCISAELAMDLADSGIT